MDQWLIILWNLKKNKSKINAEALVDGDDDVRELHAIYSDFECRCDFFRKLRISPTFRAQIKSKHNAKITAFNKSDKKNGNKNKTHQNQSAFCLK